MFSFLSCSFLDHERMRFFLWTPVCMSVGILLYVFLPYEPPLILLALVFVIICLLLFIIKSHKRWIIWALFWTIGGMCNTAWRAHYIHINKPAVLPSVGQTVWLQGKIYALEHTASAKKLHQCVQIYDKKKRIMAYVHIRTRCSLLQEGMTINCFVKRIETSRHKSDFFHGIHMRAYALSSPRIIQSNNPWLSRWRHNMTRTFYANLPVPLGTMAAALLTGDKKALPWDVQRAFSISGIAHVLAISGLHISFFAGACFHFFQYCLTRSVWLIHHAPIQHMAGIGAVTMAYLYTTFSGQNYPSLRAFTMLILGWIAFFLKRKKYALHHVMGCCLLFLCITPYALFSVSFQLSFCAVIALVAAYTPIRQSSTKRSTAYKKNTLLTRTLYRSLFTSSMVTMATFPLVSFYFHSVPLHGFLSNIVAVPWTTFVVLPTIILCALCNSVMHSFTPWWMLKATTGVLLWIAQTFSEGWEWAVIHIHPYPGWICVLQMVCMMWFFLWKSNTRYNGLWVFLALTAYVYFRSSPSFIHIFPEGKKTVYYDAQRQHMVFLGRFMTQRMSQWWIASYAPCTHVHASRIYDDASVTCELTSGLCPDAFFGISVYTKNHCIFLPGKKEAYTVTLEKNALVTEEKKYVRFWDSP